MISFFQFFTKKLRLSNPWRYKVPLLISFTYFMLCVSNVNGRVAALSFFAALGTTIGFMGFGYLTNDLSDRKKDMLAGKSNSVARLSSVEIALLTVLFVSLAIGPWFYLPIDSISIIFIIAEFTLFVFYAFPPFRLKEKGFFGVIVDALYAHAVPGFLAAWTFFLVGEKEYSQFTIFAISLCAWQVFSGIRNIVSHQLKDFNNDLASGTRTFATVCGKEKVTTWSNRIFIPLEVIAFLAFLIFIQREIPYLFIAFILFLGSAYFNFKNNSSTESKTKRFTNEFLDRFYIHWLPYIFLILLAFGNNNFWWLLIFHVLFFHPITGKIKERLMKKKANDVQSNHAKTGRKVAIISTNRNQYSETFIHAHVNSFTNVVVYSDGYFPQSVSLDKGKSWSKLSESEVTEDTLVQSWKENQIEVVLAEYGLAGAEVMHACKKARIPLVVHFHGFDAYRNDVLDFYGDRYTELFEFASAIVVVSKDMGTQLINLGCPKEKLKLIYYGVNSGVFAPDSANYKRENFIACGRFVAKKSPFNTIRAFRKVVDQFPEVKLTFIGDGELFEDSKNLSAELGLENNIDFKGVLAPAEVAREMQKHAIFVQHSIRTEENDSEGTPLSVLEAASSGLAIVATKHGGIVDVINDGESGFLVNEGDLEAMSQRMIELLNDPNRAAKMGSAARERILQMFNQKESIEELMNVLNHAEINLGMQFNNRWTVWKYRAIIFFGLFLVAEIALRFVGFKPGVIEEFYFHKNHLEYDSLMYADESGISHIVPGASLIQNGIINEEGFFSEVEYTPQAMDSLRISGKKVVMLIGDSYTQGCCAEEYAQSFASLINQSDDYEVLNFGIPGADPLQYRLIVEKYVPIIQPDLIVVAVYGGNDIMEYDRTPKPFVPLAYPIKNGPWLNSEGPIYLTKQGTYFKNFEEAKQHYFEFFSLWSDQSSFVEKLIRPSVLLSRPYMKWKTRKRFEEIKDQMPKESATPLYCQQNLQKIQHIADSCQIKTVFTLIPSPGDIQQKIRLREKYNFLFGELKWIEPPALMLEDYDGNSDGNHFNSAGHKKYSALLRKEIEKSLKN